jgi:CheY-like chemotaxis protein
MCQIFIHAMQLRNIEQIYRAPISLCTGYSERISEESAKELGIQKYIEKSIETENLAKSVREILDAQ